MVDDPGNDDGGGLLQQLPAASAAAVLERLPAHTVSALFLCGSRDALQLAVTGLRELLPDLLRRRTPREVSRCRALCLVPTAAGLVERALGITKWEQRAAFALAELQRGGPPPPLLAEWLLRGLDHRVFFSPARVAGVPEALAERYLQRCGHLFWRRWRGADGREGLSVPVESWAAVAEDGRRRMLPYQLRAVAGAAPRGGLLEFCVRREHEPDTEPFMRRVSELVGGEEVRLRVV